MEEEFPSATFTSITTHNERASELKNCAHLAKSNAMIDLYWHVNYVEKGVATGWGMERRDNSMNNYEALGHVISILSALY